MRRFLAVAALGTLLAGAARAGADANTASQAELESIKGIGPALSTQIVGARERGAFKDWSDLAQRVKGTNGRKAQQLSDAGLTVNGAGLAPSASAPASGAARP